MIRALNQTGLRRSRRDPLGLLWVWAIVCSLLGIVTPVADTIAGDAPEEEKVATSEKSEGSKDDEKLDDSEPDKGKDDAAQDDASKDGNELDAPVPDQSKDEASAPPEGDGRKLAPITPARMVEPIPDELRSRLELAPFYAKCVLADGFPILGSERVADAALLEAAHLIDTMLTGRNDVREELIRNRVRFVVMATSELTTQIPEYSDLTPSRYWDRRARGLGATRERPVVSCGEENLLGFPGDPYREENILVHEFAHAIHALGLPADFDRRLRETYDQAMARGLWRGKYAATNHHEYWAEAVQSWFGTNRPPDHDHNHVDSRPELIEYDPAVAELVRETFPVDWTYTPPSARKELPHLASFVLAPEQRFAWPPELDRWYREFHAKAREMRREADMEAAAAETPDMKRPEDEDDDEEEGTPSPTPKEEGETAEMSEPDEASPQAEAKPEE